MWYMWTYIELQLEYIILIRIYNLIRIKSKKYNMVIIIFIFKIKILFQLNIID